MLNATLLKASNTPGSRNFVPFVVILLAKNINNHKSCKTSPFYSLFVFSDDTYSRTDLRLIKRYSDAELIQISE